MTTRNRGMMFEAAAVAGPLLVLAGTRVLLQPNGIPAGAQASTAAGPMPAGDSIIKPMTPEQQRAAEWVQAQTFGSALVSPMDHPSPAPVRVDPDPAPTADPEDRAATLKGVTLSGVMGNEEGGLAAISGRVYKIGDEVKKGLRLVAIDVKENAVEFKTEDGTILRLIRKLQ